MSANSISTENIKQVIADNTTFNENRIFEYRQVNKRRLYPSIEVLENNNNNRYDKTKTQNTYGFIINIYIKRIGQMSEEISRLDELENSIRSGINTLTVSNKHTLSTSNWKRDYTDDKGPNYIVSTLDFRIVDTLVPLPIFNTDGYLIYRITSEDLHLQPNKDYRYMAVFDTEISDGYDTIEEATTKNPDEGQNVPVRFAGNYQGVFITNFVVSNDNLGDSSRNFINNFNTLRTNGEKPIHHFVYNENVNQDGSLNKNYKISDSVMVEMDQVQRLYKHDDLVIFRAIGKIIKPDSLTVTNPPPADPDPPTTT